MEIDDEVSSSTTAPIEEGSRAVEVFSDEGDNNAQNEEVGDYCVSEVSLL